MSVIAVADSRITPKRKNLDAQSTLQKWIDSYANKSIISLIAPHVKLHFSSFYGNISVFFLCRHRMYFFNGFYISSIVYDLYCSFNFWVAELIVEFVCGDMNNKWRHASVAV